MLFAGIDWSDQALDFQLRTADGHVLTEGQVRPNADGLATLFTALEAHGRPENIGIAIETTHAAWIQPILDRGYRIYPINPKTASSFRKALSAAGNKSDKIDRTVLAIMLATLHGQLRPLQPDDPDIVALRIACQDRVRLVKERTAKLNELQAVLKVHYPAFLGLFGSVESQIALEFLQAFPTQNEMLGLTPRRLRGWLHRHKYACPQRIETMLGVLKAPVLPVPEHLQTAKAPLIRFLAEALKALKEEITRREQAINRQFNDQPEADWVCSLPGAGLSLAPAVLACVGRDPERFSTTADAQALMGTAPVTKASGRSKTVHFRYGCWKFARRTLHLFADQSRRHSGWAEALYQKQRNSGHSHHQALRAVANKWVKIIPAMRRTGTRYDERKFVNSQRRYLLKTPRDQRSSPGFSGRTLT